MNELIEKLNMLFSSDLETDSDGIIISVNELVSECETLACYNLISQDGSCEWENIRTLRGSGFNVYSGDSDSFGWLTGCIEKIGNDHMQILVYG